MPGDIAIGQRGWGTSGGGQPQIQPYMGEAIANRFGGGSQSRYGGGNAMMDMLRRRLMAGQMPGAGGDPFLEQYGQPAERLANIWGRSRIGLPRLEGMQQTRQALMGGTYGPGSVAGQNQGAAFGGAPSDLLRRLLMAQQSQGGGF